MIHRTLLLFGIMTAVVGAIAPSRAQSPPAVNNPNNSSVTLSGESLTTVEGRSTEDYKFFFPPATPARNNGGAAITPGQISISATDDFPSFLEEEYGVVIGDTIRYPEYMEIFRPSGDTNSSQSIRFKIPTNSQEREE